MALIPVGPGGKPLGEVRPDVPEYYQSEPAPMPEKPLGVPVRHIPRRTPTGWPLTPVDEVSYACYVPKPYKHVNVRVVSVGQPGVVRLDSGLGNRVVVTLHNTSQWDLWFGFSQIIAENLNADVLPGSPTPGEPLGAFMEMYLSSSLEVWGVLEAAAGVNVGNIVVSEYGL